VRNCTTHHHACDCREAATRKLVNELLHGAAAATSISEFDRLRAEAVRLGYVQGQPVRPAAAATAEQGGAK
jgi:hypothetical protein